MTATYFGSDWHINHDNICNFREQFTTVQEHNECIFDNYCSIVRPKDHIYLTGDIGFDVDALNQIKRLPGIKHIVLGNHDKEKKRNITLQDLVNTFHDIHGFLRYKEFWLSHCPIHTDELRNRFNIHGHCVDLKTEILTVNGWKTKETLSNNDLIYSLNPKTQLIEIKPITEIINLNYSGTVYEFKTKSVNQRVTSNHTMVGLLGKFDTYSEILAKDLIKRNTFKYILNGQLNSVGIDLSNSLLELYIAINADASINNPNNLIRFNLNKDRKKEYIKNLLNNLNIEYREYKYQEGVNKRSSINFKLPHELLNWRLKGLDVKLLNCSKEQFELILKAYSNTDGTSYGNYSTIYTSKKEEYDLLSQLATINGYTSTTTIRHQHGFSKGISYEMYFRKCSLSITNKIKESTIVSEVNNEPFWCIKTEFQNFFMRRKGKISLTGNCHYYLINDPRYLNVCLEQTDYKPISLEQVRLIFDSRKEEIERFKNV